MKLEDLNIGSWFVYENTEKIFSAINIKELEIKEGVTEKYVIIKGKTFYIRNNSFQFINNESIFYENMLQVKNSHLYSKEEFKDIFENILANRMKDILFE